MSENEAPGRERRPVKIQTLEGTVEGFLNVNAMHRTLDDLNFARNFLVVHEPRAISSGWTFAEGPLAINKGSILFVTECADCPPRGKRIEPGRYTRAALRLSLPGFVIQGYVHVPRGGDPMLRLNQEGHRFIALTSVSVVGGGLELATPYLAVNRAHVMAAQQTHRERPGPAAPVGAAADASK